MLQGSKVRENYTNALFLRRVIVGLLGGLIGTLFMDLILMGAFSAAGLAFSTCFSIVGQTFRQVLAIFAIKSTGEVSLGVAVHYIIGPIVGVIFGLITRNFRVDTFKKCIGSAVLYVEVLSQPLLAMTPILIKMTVIEILEWYGVSFVMHFIMGVVLGAVVYCGLNQTKAFNLQ